MTLTRDIRELLRAGLHRPAYFCWGLRHAARLRRFRNIHRGEGCFVIGNGPSLNRMELSRLRGHHCFGLNKIYLLFERQALDLSYHVAVNPLIMQQSAAEIAGLQCPSFLSYSAARGVVGVDQRKYFLATGGGLGFQPNLLGLVPEGNTVTFVALQIAFFMGFSRVFLVGVDHSFACAGSANEKQRFDGPDGNHFDPDYFRGQEWHLPDLEASELAYRIADFTYRRAGRRVYDATLGGKLQVFEKIGYEEALLRCTRKGT